MTVKTETSEKVAKILRMIKSGFRECVVKITDRDGKIVFGVIDWTGPYRPGINHLYFYIKTNRYFMPMRDVVDVQPINAIDIAGSFNSHARNIDNLISQRFYLAE